MFYMLVNLVSRYAGIIQTKILGYLRTYVEKSVNESTWRKFNNFYFSSNIINLITFRMSWAKNTASFRKIFVIFKVPIRALSGAIAKS